LQPHHAAATSLQDRSLSVTDISAGFHGRIRVVARVVFSPFKPPNGRWAVMANLAGRFFAYPPFHHGEKLPMRNLPTAECLN
jgi:hypothetical protein